MALKLGGVAGDLTWNIRSKGGRWTTAGLRGGNLVVPAADGTVWRPHKKLEELDFTLQCWIVGARQDGGMPDSEHGRQLVHERYQRLLTTFRGSALGEVLDTETGRRAYAELQGATEPSTMAGGTRAEVDLDLTVPAGCWHDAEPFTLASTPFANGTQLTVPGSGGGHLPIVDLAITLTGPYRNLVITEPGGHWLRWDGDHVGSNPLVVDCSAWTAVLQGGSLNYLPRMRWSAAAMLPVTAPDGDAALTLAAESTSAATRIAITGRRRFLHA